MLPKYMKQMLPNSAFGYFKTIMTFSCFKSVFISMMLCCDTPFTSYCDKIVLREPLINVRRRIILMLQKVLNMFLKWHDVLHDGYIYGHHIYHIYITYILHLALPQDLICVLWYDNQGLGSNFRTSMSPWPTSTNWQYHTQYTHNWQHFQTHFFCYYLK